MNLTDDQIVTDGGHEADGTEREIIQYIERFGEYENSVARLVKIKKDDIETGQKETHVGIEVKLEDGSWFYKHGLGRCINPVVDWWECASCGETGRQGVSQCPSCGSMQIDPYTGGVDLPPCWKESPSDAAALGVDRLFLHLDGPGFIGIDGDKAELVRADVKAGEVPDPETCRATCEKIRDLAESYNDEFYGDDNRRLQSDTDDLGGESA